MLNAQLVELRHSLEKKKNSDTVYQIFAPFLVVRKKKQKNKYIKTTKTETRHHLFKNNHHLFLPRHGKRLKKLLFFSTRYLNRCSVVHNHITPIAFYVTGHMRKIYH